MKVQQCLSKLQELTPTEINLKEALEQVRILELIKNNVSELMDKFEALKKSATESFGSFNIKRVDYFLVKIRVGRKRHLSCDQ